jgi:hypothetical protein
MHNQIKTTIAALAGLALAGCALSIMHGGSVLGPSVRGSGNLVTDVRHVGSFSKVDAGQALEIVYTAASSPKCELSGDDNVLALITTEVKDDTLIIRSDQSFSTARPVRVTIASERLSAANIHGAATFDATGVNAESFLVGASGASKVTLNGSVRGLEMHLSGASTLTAQSLSGDQVRGELSGASDAHLSGNAEQVDLKLSGASRGDLAKLTATDVRIDARGASQAAVAADGSLSVSASGASSVHYKGNPKVSTDLTGASSVGTVG